MAAAHRPTVPPTGCRAVSHQRSAVGRRERAAAYQAEAPDLPHQGSAAAYQAKGPELPHRGSAAACQARVPGLPHRGSAAAYRARVPKLPDQGSAASDQEMARLVLQPAEDAVLPAAPESGEDRPVKVL